MKHVRTIIKKEWAEVFKRRLVVMVMLIVPLLFTVLPLIMLGVMNNAAIDTGGSLTPEMIAQSGGMPGNVASTCAGLSGDDCMQVMMVIQFLLMFMMITLILSMNSDGRSEIPRPRKSFSCCEKITIAIPAVNPTVIVQGTYLIRVPRRSMPRSIKNIPAIIDATASPG